MDSVEQTIRMNNLSKELRKYGFAQTSQDAISQAGAIYGSKEDEESQEAQIAALTKAQFDEIVTKIQRLWVFKENTDQKIGVIADQLVKVTDKLNEMIKSISLIEMNQAVFDKKLNVLRENLEDAPTQKQESHSNSRPEHVEESSNREKEKKLEKPIDRNGVAPDSVSIMKMFYCGK